MSHEPEHIEEPAGQDPQDQCLCTKCLKMLMFVSLGLLALLNVLIGSPHAHFAAEKLPGFWAFFGLVVAVVLGKVAKGAAHTFLGKDVDFYDQWD